MMFVYNFVNGKESIS